MQKFFLLLASVTTTQASSKEKLTILSYCKLKETFFSMRGLESDIFILSFTYSPPPPPLQNNLKPDQEKIKVILNIVVYLFSYFKYLMIHNYFCILIYYQFNYYVNKIFNIYDIKAPQGPPEP